jgi:ABC-type multidrug transport system ATPase subunit
MVSLENVTKDFETETGRVVRALDGFSLQVDQGELVIMMGPNGSGKSTVLRLLNGEASPTTGQIVWNQDRNGANGTPRVVHVPQDLRSLSFPQMSLEEHLLMSELSYRWARFWSRGVTRTRRLKYRELLERYDLVPLVDALDSPLGTLSGGWQQIFITLCTALGPALNPGGKRPDLTLLDEPTSALDTTNARICINLIRRLSADGHTVVIATHQPQLVSGLGARLIVMNSGRVSADVSKEDATRYTPHDIHELLLRE